jgi:hypothetical protein
MMTKEQGRKNAQNTEKELEVVWINYNPSNMNSNYSPSFTQWPSIVTCMKVTLLHNSVHQFWIISVQWVQAKVTTCLSAEFLLQVQKQEKDSAMIIHFGNLH